MTKYFKKTFLITVVLFLILLSLSSIHAENSTEISGSTENALVSSYSNLTGEFNKAEDNDVVDITGTYIYNKSTDSNLVDGNVISKNLTVEGHNGAQIDGNGLARGLYIVSNCHVTLKDILFTDCYSEIGGAAISVSSSSKLTLINCNFTNNKVLNTNGGALSAQSLTDIEIRNCTFSNNLCIRQSSLEWGEFKAGMGSAICVNAGSNLKLIDSVFKNNNAYLATILLVSYNGGSDHRSSKLYVNNCLFEDNTAYSSGVIYLDELGQGEIANSIFKNNQVTGSGGCVVLDASLSAIVRDCLFESNTAVKGGAIQIKVFDDKYKSNVKVQNCNFTKNKASQYGGAICAKYGITDISNCNFIDNYCINGGAVYTKYGSLKLTDCSFSKNSAKYGGALFLNTDVNYVDNSVFMSNKASFQGGAVYSIVGESHSSNCLYRGNEASNGANVFGIFTAKITKISSCYGYVKLTVKLTSPWQADLAQKIKLTFKGSKTYKTGWLKTDSNGVLTLKLPFDIKSGKYSLSINCNEGKIVLSKSDIFKVKKAQAKISAPKNVKRHSKIKIKIKNKASNKAIKKTKFKVKIYNKKTSKTLKLKTDKKGYLKIGTDNLAKGSYRISVILKSKNYSINNKLKVKIK